MGADNFLDEFGLADPLFVSAAFVLGHGGEGVHLVRKTANDRKFGNEMDESQEGGAPWLYKHDAAAGPKYALHFRKSLIEIFRQSGEMVQTTLDDEDVLAAIRERKLAAIGDDAFRRSSILRDEPRRQVHAFDVGEAESLESDQTVSAAAKEFDNFGVKRPLRSAQSSEARDKLLNFLFRSFETQISGFPGIGDESVLLLEICLVFGRFCF